jgi:uncharacterized protein YlxW (UPF0749 family)
MPSDAFESLSQLQHHNRELQHEVQALRDRLRDVSAEAERCKKASQEAWAFARLAFKTAPGRVGKPT